MSDLLNYKKPHFWLLLSIIFGLTTRVLYLSWYGQNMIFFVSPVGLSRTYNELSQSLIYINVFDERFLYVSPLYALFIASFRFFFGGLAWVYFFQALLGTVNIALVYVATKDLFDEKNGVIAAWIYALTPAFLFYESKLCPLTLALTLILLTMIAVKKIYRTNDLVSWGSSGIYIALLCLLYPQYFYIFVAGLAVLAVISRKNIWCNKVRIILGLVLFILVSFPFYIWYALITDEFIPLPKNLSISFYLNNPLPKERSFARTTMDMVEPAFLIRAAKFALDDSRSILKPWEITGYLAKKKIENINAHKTAFLRSIAGKSLDILLPKARTLESSFSYESNSIYLFMLFIPLPLIMIFGLVFIFFSRIAKEKVLYLTLSLGSLASCLVFNSLEEGKALVAITLIPFFAWGLSFIFDPGNRKARIYPGIIGLTVLLSFIILFQNGRSFKKDPSFSFNLALAYHTVEDYEKAVLNYREVLEMEPSNFNALNGGSIAALTAGHSEEAKEILLKAVDKYPANPDFHNNLGLAYMRNREHERARLQFLKAYENDRAHGYSLYNLGYLLRDMRRSNEALKYLRLVPDWSDIYPKSLSLTAAIYAEKGQIKKSIELYKKVQKLLKDNPYYSWKIEQLENELNGKQVTGDRGKTKSKSKS